MLRGFATEPFSTVLLEQVSESSPIQKWQFARQANGVMYRLRTRPTGHDRSLAGRPVVFVAINKRRAAERHVARSA